MMDGGVNGFDCPGCPLRPRAAPARLDRRRRRPPSRRFRSAGCVLSWRRAGPRPRRDALPALRGDMVGRKYPGTANAPYVGQRQVVAEVTLIDAASGAEADLQKGARRPLYQDSTSCNSSSAGWVLPSAASCCPRRIFSSTYSRYMISSMSAEWPPGPPAWRCVFPWSVPRVRMMARIAPPPVSAAARPEHWAWRDPPPSCAGC